MRRSRGTTLHVGLLCASLGVLGALAPLRSAVAGNALVQIQSVLTFCPSGTFSPSLHVRSVIVSPDGAHVYRACEQSIAAFVRDQSTGFLSPGSTLDLGTSFTDIQGLAAAPDGAHLYVASPYNDRLAVLERDAVSGALTLIATYVEGVDGITGIDGAAGLNVSVSPDGAHVYVLGDDSGPEPGTVAVFARDQVTGLLTLLQVIPDGNSIVTYARGFAISPDGAQVYVGGQPGLATFDRDAGTGLLTFAGAFDPGSAGNDDLVGFSDLVMSPDGEHVYGLDPFHFGVDSPRLATFDRDPTTGALALTGVVKSGLSQIDRLRDPHGLLIHPDGHYVYVGNYFLSMEGDEGVVVLRRDAATGALGFVQVVAVPLDDFGGQRVAISPDGAHLYGVALGGNIATLALRAPCSSSPMGGCLAATSTVLRVLEKTGTKDLIKWKWTAGGPITFDDPVATSTDLAFCVYDGVAPTQPVVSAMVEVAAFEPFGPCVSVHCWKTIKTGYRFGYKLGAPDGLTKIVVNTGAAGTAKLVVTGKGASLVPLALPYVAPVVVQLQASTGGCWESAFAAPTVSDATQFQAKE